MTRRPLTWIAATAAVLGVSAAVPTPPAGAGLVWTVTIDSPAEGAVGETLAFSVEGTAASALPTPLTVSVTATPAFEAPGCDAVTATGPVGGDRYEVAVGVACNGPYLLEAVGHSGELSSEPFRRAIAVEEAPAVPPAPSLTQRDDGRVVVSWGASTDPGAAGWVLVVNSTELLLPRDTLSYELPVEQTHAPVALRAVRWGAQGPGGPPTVSETSSWKAWGQQRPNTTPPETVPTPSTAPPPTVPPGTTPPPAAGSGTPPTSSSTTGPTRGTGSNAPLPEGFTEELPYAKPDDAFVPGAARRTSAATDGAETASGTPAPAGLVRTSERTSPGLVAPFAIAVMMLAVAAHIGWYLRRSRPQGPGQVSPG